MVVVGIPLRAALSILVQAFLPQTGRYCRNQGHHPVRPHRLAIESFDSEGVFHWTGVRDRLSRDMWPTVWGS